MDEETKATFAELKELAKPLQEWMLEKFNMEAEITISCGGVSVNVYAMFIPLDIEDGE